MKKHFLLMVLLALLGTTIQVESYGQCANNMGFESASFSGWTTSTDSNFITPASRQYYKPGLSPRVISYGSTDAFLGTINRPVSQCGNYLTRVGNRGLLATADTVYRTYIIDSLSDKLTIYSIGVSELAHDYWGVPIVEAPGFGYEIYVNGQKLDCLMGSFFCGNQDQPPVWQLGQFKDTANVRKSTAWAEETLNFACFVGDTIELRLFTRDCILKGHYAYAYFDVVCGDTSKPVITKIMVNDIIDADELNLYCTNTATLSMKPNTAVCPIVRSDLKWTPSSYVFGPDSVETVNLQGLDSVWIYAEANFSNFCTTLSVRDSIYVKVFSSDPLDNIPKMPRNFCDCQRDTLDFGTTTVTNVTDQNGNAMSLTNGQLIISPCDNFYEETFWKSASSRIVTNAGKISSPTWVSGNSEGAISYDSILVGGRIRFEIINAPGKRFFAGLTRNNVNNNNDIDHAIYFDGGNIRAYYQGSNLTNLGTYTGNITVEFVTLGNRRVEIWINGIRRHTYSNGQRATFPVFADFSARSADTNHINRTSVFGPTKNIKDFTRLLVPTVYSYYIEFDDRCGVPIRDTIRVIPGFEADIAIANLMNCGLTPVNMNVSSILSVIDDISATTDGDGSIEVTPPNVQYSPVFTDFLSPSVPVYITSTSGRCTDTDTANFIFHEIPVSNAGPDISTSNDSFIIGGSPAGFCLTCPGLSYSWNQGTALNDSVIPNPWAYRTLLTTTEIILTVEDPISGCLSIDTTMVYTSLSNGEVFIRSRCINDESLEFSWIIPAASSREVYGIESSVDMGQTWHLAGKIDGGETALAESFSLVIPKINNTDVQYRWFAEDVNGEKTNIRSIDDVNCNEATVYNVFPNPFTDKLELEIISRTKLKSSYNIVIYNQFGQVVFERNMQTNREGSTAIFSLNDLELIGGVYYISISAEGSVLYSHMLVRSE